jgi:hypothetical protein
VARLPCLGCLPQSIHCPEHLGSRQRRQWPVPKDTSQFLQHARASELCMSCSACSWYLRAVHTKENSPSSAVHAKAGPAGYQDKASGRWPPRSWPLPLARICHTRWQLHLSMLQQNTAKTSDAKDREISFLERASLSRRPVVVAIWQCCWTLSWTHRQALVRLFEQVRQRCHGSPGRQHPLVQYTGTSLQAGQLPAAKLAMAVVALPAYGGGAPRCQQQGTGSRRCSTAPEQP